ncbi:hypothetical protein BDV96DRAFT_639350 [Lophiotrema nucula]|uniref:Uncharacterized protein n=1 Tax=Lophiotrema nucula TaxID=690887 RepID=A0A6A5ZV75_9PLEO|nr:hypothetical protein BDV96DRAFT_639350 [Lophiotrema nucula]
MVAETYRGAAALAQSKYASPMFKARLASSPAPTPAPADTALATKDQIAAANTETAMKPVQDFNPDAQLAMAQAENLKTQVGAHSTKVDKAFSHATTNTRTLLTRIRDSLGKDSEAVKATEELWNELEKLFEIAKASKSAVPEFLEQQKDHMSLYHSSVVNEAIRDSQEELNLQHKKVNLQHSLILEHQQAFLNYKETTEPKLKERTELQERVSRLTLDKGLLKTELDNQAKASETLRTDSAEAKKTTDELRSEIDSLLSSKKRLESDNKALQEAVSKVQERLTTEQQASTDRYDQEVRRLNDQLNKGAQKIAGLDSLIKTLQTKAKQYDALKQEYDTQQMKAKNQGSEFANLREENLSFAKQIVSLKAESSGLSTTRNALQEEVVTLKSNIAANVEKAHNAEAQVKTLNAKVKKLEIANDDLETENNELVGKEAELKKLTKVLDLLKGENSKLSATIIDLQKASKTSNASDADLVYANVEIKRCQDQLRHAEERAEKSREELQQWTTLANRSYNEYQDVLVKLKAAEGKVAGVGEKDREIAKLKQELQAAKTSSQTNGVSGTSSGDAAYWKAKYEALVAQY